MMRDADNNPATDYHGHMIVAETGRCFTCSCRHPKRDGGNFALDLMMVGDEEWPRPARQEPPRDMIAKNTGGMAYCME